MANFQTHLNGGILASAGATLGLHMAGLVAGGETLPLFALGVIGSLLPDIDSDTSKPVNALFSVLGAGLAFAMTLPLTGQFLPLELTFIWLGVFLCVRYGFFEIFSRFTVHRGIWHSWLAVAVAALAATDIAYWIWERPPESAWTAGLMVGIGYLTHLCLDEFSSVDLFNSRVKRSFGTALKPFCFDDRWSSLAMLAVAIALAWVAPDARGWVERLDLDGIPLERLADGLRDQLSVARGLLGDWLSRLRHLLALG